MNKTKFNETIDRLINRTKVSVSDLEIAIHDRNPFSFECQGMFSLSVRERHCGKYGQNHSPITREYNREQFTPSVKVHLEKQIQKYQRWLEEYKKDKNNGK